MASPQKENEDVSGCFECKASLYVIFGTRCSICSKVYSDHKYCSKCIFGAEGLMLKDQLVTDICARCYDIVKTSEYEGRLKLEEEHKIMVMPNKKIFEELTQDAAVISEGDPEVDYLVQRKIAGGSFGQVYQVTDKKTNKKFAAKVLSPSDPAQRQLILNEFALTKLSRNPNIIEYHLLYERQDEIWIIQELMKVTLTSILNKRVPIPDRFIIYILKEVLKGIDFIHMNYRVHRDIKSDNVLIGTNGEIKICDLGFAAQLTNEQQNRTTLAGSPCWIAPEVIMMKPYDCKVDIWSFGVLAIECIEGEPPMLRNTVENILKNTLKLGVKLKNPDSVSEPLKNLIKLCLEKDPKIRSSASELLDLPIFKPDVEPEEFTNFLTERLRFLNEYNV